MQYAPAGASFRRGASEADLPPHALIKELTFSYGYGSSSLRERPYIDADHPDVPMSGVLIYTASGGADGTLGGALDNAAVTAKRSLDARGSDGIASGEGFRSTRWSGSESEAPPMI